MLELLTAPSTYISLATLTALEIVLGIDNIVFITIIAGRLPPARQHFARRLGLGVAVISRIALLASLSWVMSLESPLFSILEVDFTGKRLILLAGGLFLMGKASHEIYENVERPTQHLPEHLRDDYERKGRMPWMSFVIQVIILDMVFSIDSVVTAVGMVEHLPIMVAAVILAMAVMMVFAGPVGDFVQKHASIRVLALSFLVLIGCLLTAEGLGRHVPKGYVYFSMAFSLFIQLLNMRMASRAQRIEGGE